MSNEAIFIAISIFTTFMVVLILLGLWSAFR